MYERFGKRLLDILLSAISLIVLFPFFLVTSVFIKLVDPGPVIFQQIRVGRDGKEFRFYKFRSMPVNTGNIPSSEIGQVKLTWVGRFIRRSNIDELPQLFNILIGDMSIVGPRPSIPSQEELISYRRKNGALGCRPGLTGLAQVCAFSGMSTQIKAKFDGEYARSITFVKDIQIVFRTFVYLFKPPPIY